MEGVFLYDTRLGHNETKMKEDHGKQRDTEELTLNPVSVMGWILMGLLGLFLVYMAFKFLIPEVAYS
jgi:hypothetical protein